MHHVVLSKKKKRTPATTTEKKPIFVHCIRCISKHIKSSTVLNLLSFEALHNSLNRNDLFFFSFSSFKCTYPATYALQPCQYDLWVFFVCVGIQKSKCSNVIWGVEYFVRIWIRRVWLGVWHSDFQASRWKIRFFQSKNLPSQPQFQMNSFFGEKLMSPST